MQVVLFYTYLHVRYNLRGIISVIHKETSLFSCCCLLSRHYIIKYYESSQAYVPIKRYNELNNKKSTPFSRCTWEFMVNLAFGYLRAAKQSLQYTGLSSLGWNGTLQGLPQEAHTASYISLLDWRPPFLRAARQLLQRVGSFINPFSA